MDQKIDRKFLAKEALRIHECAQMNLAQLGGSCATPETTQDYYLGLLRRQAILTLDLNLLLDKSPTDNLTTPMVVCRCLMDDFLHMFYLSQNSNAVENIIKINAEGYSEEFRALEGLTKSNYKGFKGKYPFYMTGPELSDLKEKFSSKPENKKYFIDSKSFTFKKFITNAELADGVKNIELNKLAARALFLWKNFSSFTHYTNLTLERELSEKHRNNYYLQIEEALLYSYNTIKWSFHFFIDRQGLKFIDNGLEERYAIDESESQ